MMYEKAIKPGPSNENQKSYSPKGEQLYIPSNQDQSNGPAAPVQQVPITDVTNKE